MNFLSYVSAKTEFIQFSVCVFFSNLHGKQLTDRPNELVHVCCWYNNWIIFIECSDCRSMKEIIELANSLEIHMHIYIESRSVNTICKVNFVLKQRKREEIKEPVALAPWFSRTHFHLQNESANMEINKSHTHTHCVPVFIVRERETEDMVRAHVIIHRKLTKFTYTA